MLYGNEVVGPDGVCVFLGNGNITCRIARANGNLMLYVNNLSDYVDLSWGNYQRNLKLPGLFSGEIILTIRDSD